MKNTTITLLLLLCLIIISYMWWEQNTNDIDNHTIPKTKVTIDTPTIEKQIQTDEPHKVFHMEETGKDTSYIANDTKTIAPFSEETIDDMSLITKPLEGIIPIAAISMEKNSIRSSRVGDTLVLPSIDGTSYEILIKNKSVSATGNISINGDYIENGITYHSILTEGKKSTFISMTTPTGSFKINLVDGQGYVYNAFSIESNKIDYTKSDTVEIPHR